MLISEMEAMLKALREQHGDCRVYYDFGLDMVSHCTEASFEKNAKLFNLGCTEFEQQYVVGVIIK